MFYGVSLPLCYCKDTKIFLYYQIIFLLIATNFCGIKRAVGNYNPTKQKVQFERW